MKPVTKHTSEAEIRALVAQGKKFPEIAQELGVSYQRLLNACCLLGIKSPTRTYRANDFYEDLKRGMSLSDIGEKHGVTRQAVYFGLKRAGLPTTASAVLKAQQTS